MGLQKAFTLIEVLISIVLLGLIIPALYKSVDMLRDSNSALFSHLQQSQKEARAIQTLFLDIASSDGNLTIKKDTFDRLCIGSTQNSLYGLSSPKVCWVVLKEGHDLIRMEGYDYRFPLNENDYVEADMAIKEIELFDIYWQKGKVAVMLQQRHKKPVSFMVQGITKPRKPHKKRSSRRKSSSPEKNPSSENSMQQGKGSPPQGLKPPQPGNGPPPQGLKPPQPGNGPPPQGLMPPQMDTSLGGGEGMPPLR